MKEILLKVNDIEIPDTGTVTLILHPNRDVYLGTVIKDVKIGTAIELPPHRDLVEISKVKEAQRTYGQAGPWNSYVPVIVEASR